MPVLFIGDEELYHVKGRTVASLYERRGTFCARDMTVTCFRFSTAYVHRDSHENEINRCHWHLETTGNYYCRVKVNSAWLLTLFSHCLRRCCEIFTIGRSRSPRHHWISTKSERSLLKGCARVTATAIGPRSFRSKCNFAKLSNAALARYFTTIFLGVANREIKFVIPIISIAAK